MKKCLIIQPGSFGDVFVCAPIAKWYADLGYEVHWPARVAFKKQISKFNYVKYIEIENQSLHNDWMRSDVMTILPISKSYDIIINVADRGPGGQKQLATENFEISKYRIANVPFAQKYKLEWTRDIGQENKIINIVNPPSEYAFVNRASSDGVAPLPDIDLHVVEPFIIEDTDIMDWFGIIEKAKRIYSVESSFHQFIDGCGSKIKAHKYVIPRVNLAPGTRYTVSENWDLKYMPNTVTRG